MMRAALLAICALAACTTSDTPRRITTTVSDPWLQIVEPVTARVHLMRQAEDNFAGVVGNVTIIEQSDGIVLVDSGNSHGTGQRVVEAVRQISDKPVKAVVITHWHNDHPMGLSAIVAAWPDAEIIATEATRARLAEGRTNIATERSAEYEARRRQLLTQDYVTLLETNMNDPARPQAERDGWARARRALDVRLGMDDGTYLVLPNRTFQDSLRLDDPVVPIEVRFEGRANTDGDLVLWLPRQRILVAGDIVVAPIPYMFSVYPEENIRTLERLRAYDYATLIPGHGQQLRGKAYLDQLIAFSRDTRAFTARQAAEGRTLEETTAHVLSQLEPHAQAFAGDDAWLRVWFRDYAATPLIESAYREAKGEPIGLQ